MILGETQPFASPEEALTHYGVKGMRWGVRKEKEESSDRIPLTQAEKKNRAKKVAIGAGVLVAAVGVGFIAYQLHKSGNLNLSSLRNNTKTIKKGVDAVEKINHAQVDVIHLARGKDKGLAFLRQGGTPDYFKEWESALGKYAHSSVETIFDQLPDGKIAARFPDPKKRRDFAGRMINHEVIIPKSMAQEVNSIDDVINKIWPKLKDAHDSYYSEKKM